MHKIVVKGIEWQDLKRPLPMYQGLAIREMKKKMPIDKIGFGWIDDDQVYIIKSTYNNGRLLSVWLDRTDIEINCIYRRFFRKER